jgi:hypothetical protein
VCRRGVCCCEISHLDIIIIINMAFGVGRALTAPLAVINFILYLISIILAGWAINKSIEGKYIGGTIFSSKPSFRAYEIHQLVAKKEHEFCETCGLVVIDSVVCLLLFFSELLQDF